MMQKSEFELIRDPIARESATPKTEYEGGRFILDPLPPSDAARK